MDQKNVFADKLTGLTEVYQKQTGKYDKIAGLDEDIRPSTAEIENETWEGKECQMWKLTCPNNAKVYHDCVQRSDGGTWIQDQARRWKCKILVSDSCGGRSQRGYAATLEVDCKVSRCNFMPKESRKTLQACIRCIISRRRDHISTPLPIRLY